VEIGQEQPPAEPEAHLIQLVKGLRARPHLRGAPRLRRLADLLAARPEVGLSFVMAALEGQPKRASSVPTWQWVAGAGALFLAVALGTGLLGGRAQNRAYPAETEALTPPEEQAYAAPIPLLYLPDGQPSVAPKVAPAPDAPTERQAEEAAPSTPTQAPPEATPQPAPAPTPAPAPARPVGSVDLVIMHQNGVATLHGWAGPSTTYVSLDDLVRFLGARAEALPGDRHLLSWQFGSVGIAARTELEVTDESGMRFVLLTPGLQASMRIHATSWDAGNLYFEREKPV
jgi:hypothetical protein